MTTSTESNGEKLLRLRQGMILDQDPPFTGAPFPLNESTAAHPPTIPLRPVNEAAYDEIAKYASPSTCTDCAICERQFEPESRQTCFDSVAYYECVSDEDAQSSILDLRDSIEDNVEYLWRKIETHGDNLLKRWQKYAPTRLRKFGIEEKAWPQAQRYLQYD